MTSQRFGGTIQIRLSEQLWLPSLLLPRPPPFRALGAYRARGLLPGQLPVMAGRKASEVYCRVSVHTITLNTHVVKNLNSKLGIPGHAQALCFLSTSQGARIWLPDRDKVWVQATLLSPYNPNGGHFEVELEGGERRSLIVTTPTELPPLCNPDMLLGVSDLTSLSHLHEPAVLHNLHYRYTVGQNIYTYCGE